MDCGLNFCLQNFFKEYKNYLVKFWNTRIKFTKTKKKQILLTTGTERKKIILWKLNDECKE